MSIRLSADIINERISHRGIRMIGDFTIAHSKTEFICSLGHVWHASPNNIMKGKGCPTCWGKNIPLSKDIVNQRIVNTGFELVGEYLGVSTKTKFRCSASHVWFASPNGIMRGKGCPTCTGRNTPLSREIVNERLQSRGFKMICEYKGSLIKTLFECSSGHTWITAPDNLMRGSGCPKCSEYGFNPSKPAWEYCFIRDGYSKYGITNDLERRLNEHRRHGDITLVHKRYHEVGQLALDWENNIKRTYGGRYATKEECPDGHTETLPIHLLESIISS